MVLLHSEMVPLGTPAHDFHLKGIDDEMHSLESFSEAKVLVMIFMCNHCPYVQAVWDRLNSIQWDYADEGVQLVGVNPNAGNPDYPDDSFEAMKEAPVEYGMNFPYLIDETQEVSRMYGAVCTPDIFVYDKDRKLAYRGRIDDSWKDEEKVTSTELRDALDEILAGKGVSKEQKPSMGCSIKWVD